MTSELDLNIAGSPIYEGLVASTGDPYRPPGYQPPGYQLSDAGPGSAGPVARGWSDSVPPSWSESAPPGWSAPIPPAWIGSLPPEWAGAPELIGRLLAGALGDGRNWFAILLGGGGTAAQFQQAAQIPGPHTCGPATGGGYVVAQYPPAHQPPASLPGGAGRADHGELAPAAPSGEPAAQIGGMLAQDWAGWLGRTVQSARPYEDRAAPEPGPRRGSRLTGRLGAAMRELRGR
jgi:hypothetical protein